jgi:hypothetical protein
MRAFRQVAGGELFPVGFPDAIRGRLGSVAVILFNVAALKVVVALSALGAIAWIAHALGR